MAKWRLGEYLQKQLDAKGWKVSTLAKKAGLSHVYVGSIIRGENPQTGRPPNLTIDTMISLAQALDVPICSLVFAYQGKEPIKSEEVLDEVFVKDALYKCFMEFLNKKYQDCSFKKELTCEFIQKNKTSE